MIWPMRFGPHHDDFLHVTPVATMAGRIRPAEAGARKFVLACTAVLGMVLAALEAAKAQGCSFDTVSMVVQDGGQTIDPASLPVDDPFRRYVEQLGPVLTRQIAPARDESGDCRRHLRILRQKLVADSGEQGGRSPNGAGDLLLESPWVTVHRSDAACRLDVVVVWNERQILRDQASVHGAGDSSAIDEPHGPPPVSRHDMSAWIETYIASSFRVPRSEHERRRAALDGQIPLEILWLFRNATQSTRGPFQAYVSDAMDNLMARAEPVYGRLVPMLVTTALSDESGPNTLADLHEVARTLADFDLDAFRLDSIR